MLEMPAHHRPEDCPGWCAVPHGPDDRDEGEVHLSGALMVRRTLLRLCLSRDPTTGTMAGPYVLVGGEAYSLHEADALIDALTQLVDRAVVTPRAGA